MEFDDHTSASPPDPQTKRPSEAIRSSQQPTSPIDHDSFMTTTTYPASFLPASNAEDRIDVALAGNHEEDDDYESSDLECSDDDDGPESSSSDSDSDSGSNVSGKRNKALSIEQREKALIEIDAMDEDADVEPNAILYTTNEILQLPEVKKPEITFRSDSKLEAIGTIMTIVDSVVVVQASSSGEVRVLDAGTVVVAMKEKEGDDQADKEILGEIFETFGPVARPLYSIRFNSAADIPAICTIGCTLYGVPEYSSFVFTEPLKALKGSDASNRFDEEVDEIEIEFSDDEKEMEHKRMLKQAKNGKKGIKERKVPIAADTSAAMQAMMGQTPTSLSPTSPRRIPIALPPKPNFDEPVDGYRILQRPGVASHSHPLPRAPATAGTVPWYQQQQCNLQNMMGTKTQGSPVPNQEHQDKKTQEALLQFQRNQEFQQQLLMQQQQQQQLYRQHQEQQALYQKQIQEAQATILRLKQQQEQLEQQNQQLPQQHQFSNPAFNVQQTPFPAQQANGSNHQQQQILNLLSPLFPQPLNSQPPQ
ncbi:hypothetical protein BGZ65_002291 [Modicella reniformis]|uniref:H/ACA ribonucleoprotein complex non-core subunit NAF1 n=1 Tax=Modicella reniformis TaxID=1440133 RepID=A0A9P6MLK8_9FUNG|nr:hypothetical protein BGZ65_002291 [Modicella reniformis]